MGAPSVSGTAVGSPALRAWPLFWGSNAGKTYTQQGNNCDTLSHRIAYVPTGRDDSYGPGSGLKYTRTKTTHRIPHAAEAVATPIFFQANLLPITHNTFYIRF